MFTIPAHPSPKSATETPKTVNLKISCLAIGYSIQVFGTIRPQASTNNSYTIHQLLWWGTVGGTTGLIKEIKERMSL